MRIDRISVQGYRALSDVNVPLHGLNVLIGPNGSGKTSFIEVFLLLSRAMKEELGDALSALGGINDIVTRGKANGLRFEVEVPSVEFHYPLRYELEINSSAADSRLSGYQISSERLIQQQTMGPRQPYIFIENLPRHVRFNDPQGGGLRAPDWEFKTSETALSQVPRTFREPDELRRSLVSTSYLGALDVSDRAVVRLPQELRPVKMPGANGQDLFSYLYTLRSEHETIYERLEEILRIGFPGFRRLDFPLVASGKATMAWYDTFSKPFYPSELSEGTLRFIWLAGLLLSPNLPTLTLIDEPEVSLHPELLRLLAELLQEAGERAQFLVATHADQLIRWLRPEDIIVTDKAEGLSTLTRAESLDLGRWLKTYTLDQVWLMGEMGGRP